MNQRIRNGFTLIELLIVTVLLSLVLIAVYFLSRYWQENLTLGFARTQAAADAYRTVSRIAAELREIEAGESGQFPLEQADNQALTYYADVDHDGIIEQVRYFLDGETLMRGVTKPTGDPAVYQLTQESLIVAADFIANEAQPLFYYYNSDWPTDTVNNPLQSERALRTRYILVKILVRPEDDVRMEPVVASQGAHLRSLKTNY